MIKLIACDLDGTVFDDHKNIDSDLKDVTDRLRDNGIEFTVVSGRSKDLLKKVLDHFEIDVPYMTNNGADIFRGDECIGIDGVPSDLVNEMCRILYENGIVFRAYSHCCIYRWGDSAFFTARLGTLQRTNEPYDPNEDYSGKGIIKITGDFTDHPELLEPLREQILSHPELGFTKAEGNIYCINSITANKGTALQRVSDYLEIDIKDTMAFGDSENDLEMLKRAGVGVAMANADENVKTQADFVCGDNNHNGVSSFLKEYFKELF